VAVGNLRLNERASPPAVHHCPGHVKEGDV